MFPGKRCAFIIILSAVSFLLSGCATMQPSRPEGTGFKKHEAASGPGGWWHARYGIKWAENTEPLWNVDLYLADKVVRPVLEKHRCGISLWRFHRRAAPDAAGHQFSFIFYSSPLKALEIFEDLHSNPDFKLLRSSGLLIRDTYDDTSTVSKPRPEDTSDRSWSPAIQKTWPYFIMGVSEMWLSLIQEHRAGMEGTNPARSLAENLAIYQQVDRKIIQSWRDEGRHALLHHLNALFGYEPLVVYEKKMMGF